MALEIKYANKGSYTDFGYVMTGHVANEPKLRTAYVDKPFGSGCYDFSEVYGKRYDMREATITFERGYDDAYAAVVGMRLFAAWLVSISGTLYDDALGTNVGFVGARVSEISKTLNGGKHAVVSVILTAQPKLTDGSV